MCANTVVICLDVHEHRPLPVKTLKLPLQHREKRFRARVVPALALAAHALAEVGTARPQRLVEGMRTVLRAPVRMEYQAGQDGHLGDGPLPQVGPDELVRRHGVSICTKMAAAFFRISFADLSTLFSLRGRVSSSSQGRPWPGNARWLVSAVSLASPHRRKSGRRSVRTRTFAWAGVALGRHAASSLPCGGRRPVRVLL